MDDIWSAPRADSLDKENKKLKTKIKELNNKLEETEKRLSEIYNRSHSFKTALEFYADKKNWIREDIGSMMSPQYYKPIDKDEGSIAREALK